MLFELFVTFLMIGLVSFGGGYAMIPVIQEQVVERHGWMEAQQFSDVIAVAGMSPGPIATNIAIFIGYEQHGLIGALVAMFGTILPSLVLILGLGMLFYKISEHPLVKSSFYGLRSVVTGLIFYTAIMFAGNNGMLSSFSWFTWSQILIFAGSLVAFLVFRKHPVTVIAISGLVGIALYG
ncbi:chromate transporter [Paenibacillus arenilitoris]|uniref:Chromate transporter n=1 Tax=Paenibacillus arenilitoris TaxID=2772299 RepID=A0A927H3E0_9BACL|nr:chromate transporter [Paenibacillus arenilitoris]MBD2867226.1 chromate transporter [Paenibacillus arenilitoris]